MPGKEKKGSSGPAAEQPSWMPDDIFAVSQSVAKLMDYVSDSDKNKDKKDMAKITKAQATVFLWQLLFTPEGATPNKRRIDEAIKNGCMDVAAKLLAGSDPQLALPAAGIIRALVQADQGRELMFGAKPAVLPQLLNTFKRSSTGCAGAACGILKTLLQAQLSYSRTLRALKDWDFTLLLDIMGNQKAVAGLGGRAAATDAVWVLQAVCAGPPPASPGAKPIAKDEKEAAADAAMQSSIIDALLATGCVKTLLEVIECKLSQGAAKAAALDTLFALMTQRPGPLAAALQQIETSVEVLLKAVALQHLPLLARAYGAGCIWLYIAPYNMHPAVQPAPASRASTTGGPATAASRASTPSLGTSRPDAASPLTAVATAGAGPPSPTNEHAENFSAEAKAAVQQRIDLVVKSGALPWLVKLCEGPDGPLPELKPKTPRAADGKLPAGAAAAGAGGGAGATADGVRSGSSTARPSAEEEGMPTVKEEPSVSGNDSSTAKEVKGKAKGGKKGKKPAKLEPGMAEAQSYATACLRLLCMEDASHVVLHQLGVERYLLPLLEGKLDAARQNARKILASLSRTAPSSELMQRYKAPAFVHMGNIPASHYDRVTPMSELQLPEVHTTLPNQPPALSAGGAAAAMLGASLRPSMGPEAAACKPGSAHRPPTKNSSRVTMAPGARPDSSQLSSSMANISRRTTGEPELAAAAAAAVGVPLAAAAALNSARCGLNSRTSITG